MLHLRIARAVTSLIVLAIPMAALNPSSVAADNQPSPPLVVAIAAIEITVGDLDRSVHFYSDVLGFRVEEVDEAIGAELESLEGVFGAHTRSARLRLGDEAIVLTEYLTPRGRPVPPDMHSNDRAFQHVALVVSDMDRAYKHLREQHVRYVSTSPQTLPAWNKSAGGIKAFYFADPDEHRLEAIWFPPGKGDARWHPAREGLPIFLGIDHTAIVTWSTADSLHLYRDALGLHVVGTSENYGTEQEHLNNVFGAHLAITGLRADTGPGIELLEYLSPHDRRVSLPDLQANDLLHWQVLMRTTNATKAARGAGANGARRVSSDIVRIEHRAARLHRSILMRDPDGHAFVLSE